MTQQPVQLGAPGPVKPRGSGCAKIGCFGCGGLTAIIAAIFVIGMFTGSHPGQRAAKPTAPAPYVVLEEWDFPCGGHGAHGARVMVKSHNPRDLPKAWAYYDAATGHDRSKCIQFEAYSSERAVRLGKGGTSNYTDADLTAEWTNEFMYQLNANNGYEAYVYGIKRFPNGAVDIDKHVVKQGT